MGGFTIVTSIFQRYESLTSKDARHLRDIDWSCVLVVVGRVVPNNISPVGRWAMERVPTGYHGGPQISDL
jgi:hypothetical protein